MTVVRRAVEADLETLLPLIREFNALDRHPHDDARVRRALVPLLRDDSHGQVWLIDDTGYAVVTWGYSLESGGRDALLDELYVRERGHGAGAEAMREILRAAAKAGASRMFLETEAHNERVRRFYARLGFTEEDSIWMSKVL